MHPPSHLDGRLMRYFVTGGAGFIGSHVVERLLASGAAVTVYDNFGTGRREFLEEAGRHRGYELVEGDLLDLPRLTKAMHGHDFVFHLAANADVRFGLLHPSRDLEQNTIATFHVLEAMRASGARRLAFTSTGSVYGEPEILPTPEDCAFPTQTSLYGASKLAGEALVSAYCAGFGFEATIFRLVSILGDRYSHGHVFDFYKKLLADPLEIEVLGDGQQRKSYLHVHDCVDGMLWLVERPQQRVSVFNLGTEETCTVDESLGWICARLGVTPRRLYTGGRRGWVGDSPLVLLDTARARKLGWQPRFTIRDSVLQTVEYLERNRWLLTRASDGGAR